MMENVLIKDPSLQSRAALILLRKKLLRQCAYHGYQGWLRFRWELLNKWLLEKKVLKCYYCNVETLVMEDVSHRTPTGATLDHVIPLSKHGKRWDESNLVVACYNCNQKKKNLDKVDFLKRNVGCISTVETSLVKRTVASSNLVIQPTLQ